jgi:hypothetical protein
MINEDVIDLYDRTPIGTKVAVLPSNVPSESYSITQRDR